MYYVDWVTAVIRWYQTSVHLLAIVISIGNMREGLDVAWYKYHRCRQKMLRENHSSMTQSGMMPLCCPMYCVNEVTSYFYLYCHTNL